MAAVAVGAQPELGAVTGRPEMLEWRLLGNALPPLFQGAIPAIWGIAVTLIVAEHAQWNGGFRSRTACCEITGGQAGFRLLE